MGEITLIKNNIKLRNEDKLLLYCARTQMDGTFKTKMNSLIQEELDWPYLLEMASQHGLTPLLYYNLNKITPESIPADILSKLKNYFKANLGRNLLLTGELIKIKELFKSKKIDAVPFKGPSLTILAYNNLALREFVDLDIIVEKKYNLEVYELMHSLGYVLDSYPKNTDLSIYFKTQSEHKYINKNMPIVVEIHNKFQGHFFYFPINTEFLYDKDNLKPVEINNYPMETLSMENLLLMLSIHCARHDWSRLIWICDIYQLIQLQELNWNKLLETAENLGVKRILLINLNLAQDLFDLHLSENIIRQMKDDKQIELISAKLKQNLFDKDYSFNLFEKTLLDLKKRESLKLGFIDVLSSILKPTYQDYKELYLPSSLYFLYYIIRPFLLLRRYFKGSL